MIEIAGGIILAVFFFIGVLLMFTEEGRELLSMIFGGIMLIVLIAYLLLRS